MEYLEGFILMVLIGVLIQRRLAQKGREYVPVFWTALGTAWAYALLVRPYIWARIVGDLSHLM